MIFPWTTVDSIVDDFHKKVEELDQLAEKNQKDAASAAVHKNYWEQRIVHHNMESERARKIAIRIADLIS